MAINKHIYTDGMGKERVIDFDQIREAVTNRHRIALIKEYRHITKAGLKDSKDAIENAMVHGADEVVDLFKEKLGISDPYTKEEFIHLIENTIDNMEHLHFDDMLKAVMVTLENIEEKGGLDHLVKERNKFLNSI